MLDAFADLPMPDLALDDSRFSIKTQEGVAQDTYDFDLLITDPEMMGFGATDLRIVGSANIRDTHFSYEAPLNVFRVEVGMEDEDTPEILKVNPKAQKPNI